MPIALAFPRAFLARSLALCLASLLFAAAGHAGEVNFPRAPEGFRGGLEIELGWKPFARIAHYFDFAALQARFPELADEKIVGRYFFDDYLSLSPPALAELPPELRRELTRGLPQDAAYVPEGADLVLISTRWGRLGFERRRALVSWEHLHPMRKTKLLFNLLARFPPRHDVRKLLTPKPDLPPAVAALLARLTWSVDGGNVLEFQHRADLTVGTPAELYADIVALARLADVEEELLESHRVPTKEAMLHFHLSRRGAYVESWAPYYNRLVSLQRIHAGVLRDFSDADYKFREDVWEKGLVRVIAPDRLEQRLHARPVAEEIALLTRLLSLDEEAARELIEIEIRALLDDITLERILGRDYRFAEFYTPWMSAAQRARFEEMRARFGRLSRTPDLAALWRRFPQLVRSGRQDFDAEAGELIAAGPAPASLWPSLPGLLANPRASARILERLLSKNALPAEFEPSARTALLEVAHAHPKRFLVLLPQVWNTPHLPTARRLTELFRDPKIPEARLLDALVPLPTNLFAGAPGEELWAASAGRSAEMRALVLSYLLRGEASPSPAIWAAVTRILSGPQEGTAEGELSSRIGGRSDWPPELWPVAWDRAERSTQLNFRASLLRGLAAQTHPAFGAFAAARLNRLAPPPPGRLPVLAEEVPWPPSVYAAMLANERPARGRELRSLPVLEIHHEALAAAVATPSEEPTMPRLDPACAGLQHLLE